MASVKERFLRQFFCYCFYSNILFSSLRRSGYGCWVNGRYHGIFGYSDDNLLLAPSIVALQKMLRVCESFATEHNMKFSTDENPQKCKTKCIAFTSKNQNLPPMVLCGNSLPWVDQIKHLGHNISNLSNFTDQDLVIKRAQFVNKNIELNQEFAFASARHKFQISNIYNSHYYGSPIWDLFGKPAESLLSSYNRSVRVFFNLPLRTHRNLIEPVTGCRHLFSVLVSRFLGFLDKIRASNKIVPKLLLSLIQKDTRCITGSNLRNIMLEVGKDDVLKLVKSDSVKYFPLEKDDEWKSIVLSDLIEVRDGSLVLNGLDHSEIENMIELICTK